MPCSDPICKRLYAFAEMVAYLLRSLFPRDALGADYGAMRKLPAEYRRCRRSSRGSGTRCLTGGTPRRTIRACTTMETKRCGWRHAKQ